MKDQTNLFAIPSGKDRQYLQQLLQECVLAEKYEMAAVVRDKIRAIQQLEGKRVEVIVKPGDRSRERGLLKREFDLKISVCRQDLIHPQVGMSQYNALRITDAEIQRIASKMADTFREDLFWASLKTIVDGILRSR